ncbi:MAG: PAS domain S-box-containing protein [Flavobacterium sp.]
MTEQLIYIALLGLVFLLIVIGFLSFKLFSKEKLLRDLTLQSYKHVLDKIDHPCYIMHKQKNIFVNACFLNKSYLGKDFLGADAWEKYGDTLLKEITYPEFRARLLKGEWPEFKAFFREKDSAIIHLTLTANLINAEQELILVDIHDLSEARDAARKLEENSILLDRAQHIANLGYWYSSPEAHKLICSSGTNEIFGLNTPELIKEYASKSRWPLIHEADIKECQRIVNNAYNEGIENNAFNFRIVRPDGQVRHTRNQIGVLKNNRGEIVRIVGVIKDITKSIRDEDQLRHAQKMEAVGELTGGLSHDFNNLLHVILGNVELISLPSDKEDLESLKAIRRAAERGSELTQRLLAFSSKQFLNPKIN